MVFRVIISVCSSKTITAVMVNNYEAHAGFQIDNLNISFLFSRSDTALSLNHKMILQETFPTEI